MSLPGSTPVLPVHKAVTTPDTSHCSNNIFKIIKFRKDNNYGNNRQRHWHHTKLMATISRLDVEESDKPLFVWTKFDDDDSRSLTVRVSDGACTWQGTLCIAELQVMANNSKMPLRSFLDETAKALSRKNMGGLAFVYSIRCLNGGVLELAWKKHLVSDGIKFQVGNIELIPDKSGDCFLLNYSLGCIATLERKIEEAEENCKRSMVERQAAIDSLQACSSIQKKIEDELYGKFKLILNEKKSKIRKLMESNSHLQEQNEEMLRQVWNAKRTGTTTLLSDEHNTKECSTEVERMNSSKQKQGVHMESLLCDAPCKPPSPPPPAKRHRLNNRGARKTKVELPHPPHLSSSKKSKLQPIEHVDQDHGSMSIDSNELLDML